jgi:hypothetical protein
MRTMAGRRRAAAMTLAAAMLASCTPPGPAPATPAPSGVPSPAATPTASPSPSPSPTPEPTPVLVPSALTGLLVDPAAAAHRPIAVMIDDLQPARPQSGFNAASIVWQGPAEGGIPRYMLVFGDVIPGPVGPIRSARQYFVDWAAEWHAVYVHAGGSPGALDLLRAEGRGTAVWNAEALAWIGTYAWRVDVKVAPHNLYTDGDHLRAMAAELGAADGPAAAAWTFGTARSLDARPAGGTIVVHYPYERITYRYDPATNRYVRFLDRSTTPQVDEADGRPVAPTNVVILRMAFGPLDDGSHKNRLEAADVGTGEAIIATNGRTVVGTWRKDGITSPTLLFGPDGAPFALTPGQTFVQVLPLEDRFEIEDGVIGPVTADAGGRTVR